MTITQMDGIGWSGTTLAQGTATRYAAELQQLAGAITAYRYAEGALPSSGDGGRSGKGENGGSGGGGKGSPKNGVVLVCDCRRRIRVSASVAALGPIICGICSSHFLDIGSRQSRTSQNVASGARHHYQRREAEPAR